MKIVYYLPSLYMSGGLERIITIKANYFADNLGYDVTILTSEQDNRTPYYKLSPEIQHVDLGVNFDLSTKKKNLLSKVLRYPFRYWLFKKRFKKFLYNQKPDITISTLRRELNFLNNLRDGSIKIGEFHVTRYAYHANAMRERRVIRNIFKKYWGKQFVANLSRLGVLVVLTEEEKANWPELQNIKVINNPLPFFPERTSDCNSKKVIAVGRYTYQKGFDMLIDAWKIVSQKHTDWKLYIYGEGDEQSLTTQINRLGLQDNCFLEKPVSNINDKYTESSIFVLSSRFEGFGMVIVESMACGVPPISFDCPCGPKDIIQDSIDGLLVPKDDINELASSICKLIEDDDLRKRLGAQARINSQRFKIDNIALQWKQLFETLTKAKI